MTDRSGLFHLLEVNWNCMNVLLYHPDPPVYPAGHHACATCFADWPRLFSNWDTADMTAPLMPTPAYDTYQSIGVKCLLNVCKERGLPVYRNGHSGPTKKQEELVEMLQACPDFSKKTICERTYVTELCQKRGHVALFGVKYHAELAHIERKWMWLKQKIRPRLNGSLRRLSDEL